jgi:hypothetical protein
MPTIVKSAISLSFSKGKLTLKTEEVEDNGDNSQTVHRDKNVFEGLEDPEKRSIINSAVLSAVHQFLGVKRNRQEELEDEE